MEEVIAETSLFVWEYMVNFVFEPHLARQNGQFLGIYGNIFYYRVEKHSDISFLRPSRIQWVKPTHVLNISHYQNNRYHDFKYNLLSVPTVYD